MRILHVNKFLYRRGGAESYLLDVAERQRAAGHEVELFGMQHPANPPLTYAGLFPSQLDLEDPPASLSGRVRATARMVYSAESRRGLAAVLREFEPDVVHMHNIYHQLSPSILRATRDAGVATVMTLHDYKLACPSYLMLAGSEVCEDCLDGHFLRHAVATRCKDGSLTASVVLAAESTIQRRIGAYDPVQAFLCPSRFLAGVMTRAGVYVDRLVVVPNFIDAQPITPKSSPGGGVVYAGRLSEEKGVTTLVEAAGRMPSLRVDIVGDGPQRAALRSLADQVAPGRVTFHGRVSRQQVLDLMRANAVAVLPSYCHENQPMAALEAFACGLPVVASALGGLPEAIPESCGVLVPPRDPGALARQLDRLVGDPAAAFSMGRTAREHVVAQYAPGRHLQALAEIYDRAMSTTSAGVG
ncbi:MAG: glycosyltransferase family 4 protein [Marmoricola sp.]